MKKMLLVILSAALLASCGNSGVENTLSSSTELQVSIVQRLATAESADAAFLALSVNEKKAVEDYLQLDSLETERVKGQEITAQANGCFITTDRSVGKNRIGHTLFILNHQVRWCSDGKKITSASKTQWPESVAPLVSFVGYTENGMRGVGTSLLEAFTSGTFKTGTYGVDLFSYNPRVYTKISATK